MSIEKFAAITGANPKFIVLEQSGGEILVPEFMDLFGAEFVRQGADLLLVGKGGTTALVKNYFASDLSNGEAWPLVAENGGVLSFDLVKSLAAPAAPGQYAQAGPAGQGAAIGQVATVTGDVTATRVDGTVVTLTVDSPVFQGDELETGDGAAIGLVFNDKSSFALDANARLVLDSLIYDPSTGDGSSTFSMVRGVFVFVSGEIAANNPEEMTITTPVATIGVRGTSGGGDVGKIVTVGLFPEEEGKVTGSMVVTGPTGWQVILSDPFASVSIAGADGDPIQGILSPAQVLTTFGNALDTMGTDPNRLVGRSEVDDRGGDEAITNSSSFTATSGDGAGDDGDADDLDPLDLIDVLEAEEMEESEEEEEDVAADDDDEREDDEDLILFLLTNGVEVEDLVEVVFVPQNNNNNNDGGMDTMDAGMDTMMGGGVPNDEVTPIDPDDPVDEMTAVAALASNVAGFNVVDGTQSVEGTVSTFSNLNLGTINPVFSIGDGLILTTGEQNPEQFGPEVALNVDSNFAGDDDLDEIVFVENIIGPTSDAAVVEFDFTSPAGANSIILEFFFATEEFPDQENTPDIAAIFVDAGGNPRPEDNVLFLRDNGPVGFFFGQNEDQCLTNSGQLSIGYDGLTEPRTLPKLLGQGANHSIKIAIADTGDAERDSALFISIRGFGLAAGAGDEGAFIVGSDGDDQLTGGAGDDFLFGLAGNDDLTGAAGNDTLDGGEDETSVFGTDFDSVDYSNSQAGVTVDLANGTALDGLGGTDTLEGIEEIEGSGFSDLLIGGDPTGNFIESFEGLAGDDTIQGGNLVPNSLIPKFRVEYDQDPTGVTVDLENGTALDGFGDTDSLSNISAVVGSAQDDLIIGNDSATIEDGLEGLGGDDTIDGGGGFDKVAFLESPAGVSVDLTANTALDGFGGTDTLIDIEGALGSDFADTFTGNASANAFEGRGGNDTVDGAAGNDTIRGDAGEDNLTGGPGADDFEYAMLTDGTFVANNVTAASVGATGDIIAEFVSGIDNIVLDATEFGFDVGQNFVDMENFARLETSFDGFLPTQPDQQGSSQTFNNNEPTVIFSEQDGALYYDANGSDPGVHGHRHRPGRCHQRR